MKEFIVTFTLKPAVNLDRKLRNIELTFKEPKGTKKVVISKIEETIEDQKIQTGLSFRVFIKEQNIIEAKEEAKSFIDGIVSFITLVTGVGLQIPREELAFEVTQDTEKRQFLQVFTDPLEVQVSRRKLNHELLTKLIGKSLKLDSLSHYRVARALRWYRMGALTFDAFDKFNCFWIGLEALNPILKEKLSAKDDPVVCPKCKHEWILFPTVAGIRTLIKTKLLDYAKLYRRIHQLRTDIVHSKRELSKIRDEAVELTPRIAEILYRTICYVLDIEEWDTMSYKTILEQVPIRIEVEGALVGGEPDSLGLDGKDPHLEPHHDTSLVKVSENGSVSFEAQSKFTVRTDPEVKLEMREIRFYGDSEVKGSIKETKVERSQK